MTEIVLKGVMRSGNTVLRLLLISIFNKHKCFANYTFRENINKIHQYENLNSDKFLITTWRDPRDVVNSMIRIENHKYNFSMPLTKYYPLFDIIIKEGSEGIHKVRTKVNNALILKYAHWHPDYDLLFDDLEKTFKGNIPKNVRNVLKEKYSKQSIKKIQSSYKTFSQYNTSNYVHGLHIGPNNGESMWEHNIPTQYHKEINKILKKYITFWEEIE